MSQNRSKYGVSSPVRLGFTAGVASGFASSVHFFSNLITSNLQFIGNWSPVAKIVNYSLSGLAFIVSGKLIKTEFDKSNEAAFGLEDRLTVLQEENKQIEQDIVKLATRLESDKAHLLAYAETKDIYTRVRIASGVKNIFNTAEVAVLPEKKEIVTTRQPVCSRASLIKPGRRFVAFGIGSDLSIGVNYCVNLFSPLVTTAGMTAFNISNYAFTGITLVFGYRFANKKLKIDIDLNKELNKGVLELMESSRWANEAVNILRIKQEPLKKALACIDDRVIPEEKSDDGWVDLDRVEFELDDEKTNNGCLARCGNRMTKCRENSVVAFVASAMTGGVIAPSVYKVGKIVIGIVAPYIPYSQVVTGLEVLNGAVTAANFATTTFFAHKKIKVNPHETITLAAQMTRLEKTTAQTKANLELLKSSAKRKHSQLKTLVNNELDTADDDEAVIDFHQLTALDAVSVNSSGPASPAAATTSYTQLPQSFLSGLETPKLLLSSRVPQPRSSDIELDVVPPSRPTESKRSGRPGFFRSSEAQLQKPLLEIKLTS